MDATGSRSGPGRFSGNVQFACPRFQCAGWIISDGIPLRQLPRPRPHHQQIEGPRRVADHSQPDDRQGRQCERRGKSGPDRLPGQQVTRRKARPPERASALPAVFLRLLVMSPAADDLYNSVFGIDRIHQPVLMVYPPRVQSAQIADEYTSIKRKPQREKHPRRCKKLRGHRNED